MKRPEKRFRKNIRMDVCVKTSEYSEYSSISGITQPTELKFDEIDSWIGILRFEFFEKSNRSSYRKF